MISVISINFVSPSFLRFSFHSAVLPEQPVVLDRWGGPLNGSKIGPVHENDDIMLTCRVVGGELLRCMLLFRFLRTFLFCAARMILQDMKAKKSAIFPSM